MALGDDRLGAGVELVQIAVGIAPELVGPPACSAAACALGRRDVAVADVADLQIALGRPELAIDPRATPRAAVAAASR